MPKTPIETIVFRRRENQRTLRWTGVSIGLVLLPVAAFIAADPRFEPWEAGIPLAIAAWCLYLGTRVADSAAWVSPTGIKIVNPLSTRRVEWKQVQEFALARYGVIAAMGWVVLKDGQRLHIWAIQEFGSIIKRDPVPEREVKALNQILEAVQGGRFPSRPSEG